MSLRMLTKTLLAFSLLVTGVLAHPGEEHSNDKIKKDIAARELAEAHARQLTAKCVGSSTHKSLQARSAARRSVAAQLLREKRGVVNSETTLTKVVVI